MNNCVGIDVSKGKSMVAIMRPCGEVVALPFEVHHTSYELTKLSKQIRSLEGETRIVMEATGNYHLPIAQWLSDDNFYVSVVNPILIHNYENNSLRKVKTDKKDAIKIANYGLDRWDKLRQFIPTDEIRALLKCCCRQLQQTSKVQTMLKNNLISLLDNVFPGVNELFCSPVRKDGSEKWVDFVAKFWHCECVCGLSPKAFSERYRKWCNKCGYHYSEDKAEDIYVSACGHVCVMPKTDSTKRIVLGAVSQLQSVTTSVAKLKAEMTFLAEQLPEYGIVMQMFGVGSSLGPQLMAEIGDVRRFASKKSLVAFAGIDSPPCDSGKIYGNHRSITKRGSAFLRRTLFILMTVYLQRSPVNEPVYQFMDKKRSEGKPYRVYMMASANKFLRIYYATVKKYLDSLEES